MINWDLKGYIVNEGFLFDDLRTLGLENNED